ncbi:MAG: alpha/beta fold hydrolase [Comamonadaceae bacterium]|nr:alpha/beta fold hydrolase [Comamonadaceae bacterium]
MGERFEYSNLNYVLLGAVLQAATGRPWRELMQERVLQPLAMTHSHVDHDAGAARRPDGRAPDRRSAFQSTRETPWLPGLRTHRRPDGERGRHGALPADAAGRTGRRSSGRDRVAAAGAAQLLAPASPRAHSTPALGRLRLPLRRGLVRRAVRCRGRCALAPRQPDDVRGVDGAAARDEAGGRRADQRQYRVAGRRPQRGDEPLADRRREPAAWERAAAGIEPARGVPRSSSAWPRSCSRSSRCWRGGRCVRGAFEAVWRWRSWRWCSSSRHRRPGSGLSLLWVFAPELALGIGHVGAAAVSAVGVALLLATPPMRRWRVIGLAIIAVAAGRDVRGACTLQERPRACHARARRRAARLSIRAAARSRCSRLETARRCLMIHGSGGGHDQGMAWARPLAQHGVRVIAMSRFGYLRTPRPADASPEAQADAHVCLLDALGIAEAAVMGVSAGAPSALQTAIRHPDRVSALVLVVPHRLQAGHRGRFGAAGVGRKDELLLRLLGSDFLFWTGAAACARPGDPPRAGHAARAGGRRQRGRARARQRRWPSASCRCPRAPPGCATTRGWASASGPYALESIHAPTLVVSARDDGFGTYAAAEYTASRIAGAKFLGFASGGHLLVGREDEVQTAITALLAAVR